MEDSGPPESRVKNGNRGEHDKNEIRIVFHYVSSSIVFCDIGDMTIKKHYSQSNTRINTYRLAPWASSETARKVRSETLSSPCDNRHSSSQYCSLPPQSRPHSVDRRCVCCRDGPVAETLSNAGYTQPGAIPVATPVPMGDDQTYGLLEQPLSATLVPQEKLGKSSNWKQQPTVATVPVQSQNFAFDDVPASRNPMMMRQCPSCGQESRTRVSTYPAWQTWTASVSQ